MNLQFPAPLLRLSTGPVDDLELIESDITCPKCGSPLALVPLQEGRCHSGLFATRVLREHYWCDECADIYVPTEPQDVSHEKEV